MINVSVEDNEGGVHFEAQYYPRTPTTPQIIQVQYTQPCTSGGSNTTAQVSPSPKAQDPMSWACDGSYCVLC